jgi:flagellar hook protein FlgE
VPNVSLEREAVEQISAARAYKASAKLISTVDDMTKTLLKSFK